MASRKKSFITEIALLIVVAIALAISMAWSLEIELKLGLAHYEMVEENAEKDSAKSGAPVARSASGELKVHFLDIGQGDCCIIEFPDGKTMIIDGANRGKQDVILNYIENTLPDGFSYFDYAVLTHPDADHCGSLDDVLKVYPAKIFYRPNVEATYKGYVDPGKADLTPDAVEKNEGGSIYRDCLKVAYAVNGDITPTVLVTNPDDADRDITGGDGDNTYRFEFFSPLGTNYGEEWNDYSPIMILEYKGFTFAMSGDAEKDNLNEFVAKAASAETDGVKNKYDIFTDQFNVNVIKAGHHGSENATTSEYLDVLTSPDGVGSAYCVISCGKDNTYGHPHKAALDRYAAAGFSSENILRTDELGNIEFSVRADENGVYNLYYGDKASTPVDPSPVKPNPEPEPDPDPEPGEPVYKLVYIKLSGVELKWPVVAWSCYAVLVLIFAVQMFITHMSGGRGKNGRSGGSRAKGGGR